MIYFIVTTSIHPSPIREQQYRKGITALLHTIKKLDIKHYKVIIVENNGRRRTFLNDLGEVYYTNNNRLQKEKGYKELQDVLDCIHAYSINDTDFIVKMTGRYILKETSEFMNCVKDIEKGNTQCIIKYGSYLNPVNHKMNDCITGLIGMSCVYIKQIEKPTSQECVEWKWAMVTNLIDNDKIHIVKQLGINICPGSNHYFEV